MSSEPKPHALPEVQELLTLLGDVEDYPSMPRVAVIYGETGRGKTYRVQQFYDLLASLRPGYFVPGLTPPWPCLLYTSDAADE